MSSLLVYHISAGRIHDFEEIMRNFICSKDNYWIVSWHILINPYRCEAEMWLFSYKLQMTVSGFLIVKRPERNG